jgi:hypothetical protein
MDYADFKALDKPVFCSTFFRGSGSCAVELYIGFGSGRVLKHTRRCWEVYVNWLKLVMD